MFYFFRWVLDFFVATAGFSEGWHHERVTTPFKKKTLFFLPFLPRWVNEEYRANARSHSNVLGSPGEGAPANDPEPKNAVSNRKINIDTDLRLAATGAIRKYLNENKSVFDMRKYNIEAISAMRKICISKFNDFHTSGKVSKINL